MSSPSLKVLFLVPQLGQGGAERVTASLCDYFVGRGAEVSVLMTHGAERSYPVDRRVRVFSLGIGGGRLVGFAKRLVGIRAFLADTRPDVVVSLECCFRQLCYLRVWKNCTLVVSERNYPPMKYGPFLMRLIKRLFKYADGVVFQTEEAAACFSDCVHGKSAVIPNAVLGNLPANEGSRDSRVVTFCRLVPQKNLDLLLDAFSVFHAGAGEAYRLEVYGDGPLGPSLLERAKKLGIADAFSLLPFSTDIHARVKGAGMFVSSSDFEGLQNSLIESMAMGIPCVATDCLGGGARMVTDGGRRGLLVPRGDATALSDAMARVALEPGLADNLSEQGREINGVWSRTAICERWYDYVTSLNLVSSSAVGGSEQ